MTFETNSSSYEETISLGTKLGSRLRGGEIIELISDLGGGKTAFTAGLAEGVGSEDQVSSPSFTINQIYKSPKLTINHYDLYRLEDPGIMKQVIAEAIDSEDTVLVLEWALSVRDVLPSNRIQIYLTPTSMNSRKIKFVYPENSTYLLEDLRK